MPLCDSTVVISGTPLQTLIADETFTFVFGDASRCVRIVAGSDDVTTVDISGADLQVVTSQKGLVTFKILSSTIRFVIRQKLYHALSSGFNWNFVFRTPSISITVEPEGQHMTRVHLSGVAEQTGKVEQRVDDE